MNFCPMIIIDDWGSVSYLLSVKVLIQVNIFFDVLWVNEAFFKSNVFHGLGSVTHKLFVCTENRGGYFKVV